jgi:hypothetical protein
VPASTTPACWHTAGAVARGVFPNLARLVFTIGEDIFGPSVSLVAAYDAAG